MPSTAIQHFSYDEAARELHVTFVGGGSYTYYGVPKSVYAGLRSATSRGRYLNLFIKDRYDFRRHEKSA
jgi:hypothetical protein